MVFAETFFHTRLYQQRILLLPSQTFARPRKIWDSGMPPRISLVSCLRALNGMSDVSVYVHETNQVSLRFLRYSISC